MMIRIPEKNFGRIAKLICVNSIKKETYFNLADLNSNDPCFQLQCLDKPDFHIGEDYRVCLFFIEDGNEWAAKFHKNCYGERIIETCQNAKNVKKVQVYKQGSMIEKIES